MGALRGWFRFFMVSIGIVLLTSVTIDATTSYNVSQSALGIIARNVTESSCPAGMVEFMVGGQRICGDRHEVSAGAECPIKAPVSAADTAANISAPECTGVSTKNDLVWTNVAWHQAKEICARRGMRLPTNEEWYELALGTPDSEVCNIQTGSVTVAGGSPGCTAGSGARDMVGNVWEWVDGEVISGIYNERDLPPEGYVQNADTSGVAIETGRSPNVLFHKDYFWSATVSSTVMMRGGFYGSGEDAGIYSIHAEIEPTFSGTAIGFRCVADL